MGDTRIFPELKSVNMQNFKINHLKARDTQHNSAVWPVPYACAQPYHPGPIKLGDPHSIRIA